MLVSPICDGLSRAKPLMVSFPAGVNHWADGVELPGGNSSMKLWDPKPGEFDTYRLPNASTRTSVGALMPFDSVAFGVLAPGA